MEFEDKQYDGDYEVCGVDITCEGEVFNGVLYFPPEEFPKPVNLIIYFHGFPQLFTLTEIVRKHQYLLDKGFAFLIFNFRGYRYSQGKVSIESQLKDALEVSNFAEKMSQEGIFNISNINILAHDFGSYIALLLSSNTKILNRVALIAPILDLKKHVYNEGFEKAVHYVNRFLPGNIRGMENPDEFIEMTKSELSNTELQIENVIKNLNLKEIKVIIGENDDLTPVSEVEKMFKNSNIEPNIRIIKNMSHEFFEDSEIKIIREELLDFFKG